MLILNNKHHCTNLLSKLIRNIRIDFKTMMIYTNYYILVLQPLSSLFNLSPKINLPSLYIVGLFQNNKYGTCF